MAVDLKKIKDINSSMSRSRIGSINLNESKISVNVSSKISNITYLYLIISSFNLIHIIHIILYRIIVIFLS